MITRIIEALLILAILFCIAIVAISYWETPSPNKRIGIVVPFQHAAMDSIICGYVDTIKKNLNGSVSMQIENAQGDLQVQRRIIRDMIKSKVDIIVPVGISATNMVLAEGTTIPIVSLATELSQATRDKLKPCNIAVVHDEIYVAELLEFFKAIYPNITEITLVHSDLEKVLPEVENAVVAGKKLNLNIMPVLMTSYKDLRFITNLLNPHRNQALFILKDNMIAANIQSLVKAAEKYKIPFMSSDEGTVQMGAAFALGVHEHQIGEEGAELTEEIISGRKPCSLPIVGMSSYTVFINKKTLQRTNQSFDAIENAAAKLNYQIESLVH